MHAGPLSSPRLQRVLAILSDGREHTTRDIVRRARVMAVNACISELRAHGAEISCAARMVMRPAALFLPDGKGAEDVKTPTLMQAGTVRVADIVVGRRLRPASEAGVESLIASIREVGVMKDAIHLRQKKDGARHLIAGAHRLEAARRLGWDEIEAKIWTGVTDDWALLMEIDDNLAGAEMSALDTAVFLARRKEVYERLHPETKAKAGAALAEVRWNAADMMSVASFAAASAEKFGLTERHIRRMIAAGVKLGPDEVAKLRSAPRPLTLKDVQDIGRIGDAAERYAVVDDLTNGRARSVGEARRSHLARTKGEVVPPKDPVDEGFKALLTLWHRVPAAARRRFADEVGDAIVQLRGRS